MAKVLAYNMKFFGTIWLILELLLSGCSQVSTEPPVSPEPPSTGGSSFVFVEEPAAPLPPPSAAVAQAKPRETSENFCEAVPIYPLVKPIYPAKALNQKAGWAVVGVRITVGIDGRVMDVGPSLLTVSTPGPFADDFFEAVRVAVQQWRFEPAEIEHYRWLEAVSASQSKRIRTAEKTETYFDLTFTFTATGSVLNAETRKR